jgi:hypothetical protein
VAFGGRGQGSSVALSSDGSTAIVGAYENAGAASVFTRTGGVWSQQGDTLVGTEAAGANQGWSVAISADGNTAIVGGPSDGGASGGPAQALAQAAQHLLETRYGRVADHATVSHHADPAPPSQGCDHSTHDFMFAVSLKRWFDS